MTYTEAIKEAKFHAQANGITAYVHTSPCLGFNFRFLAPIESTGQAGPREQTVARIESSGEVFEMKGAA